MVLRFLAISAALFFGCSSFEWDNPNDKNGTNYQGGSLSSSSVSSSSMSNNSSSVAVYTEYCLIGGDCYEINYHDPNQNCNYYGGISVTNCLASSSSNSEPSGSSSSVAATYALIANVPGGGGTVSVSPSSSSYEKGTVVAVTAEPSAGYRFAGWSGALISAEASIQVTMDENKILIAEFELIPLSSSSSSVPSSSSIAKVYGASVTYQGETYQTVVIGTQTWFARNLNYEVDGSKCYAEGKEGVTQDSINKNCEKYGRLYDWAMAMAIPSSCNISTCSNQIQTKHQGICPTGWHIPTYEEWKTLSSYVQNDSGCSSCDGTLLKATDGWYNDGNGTDAYGFAALPGGNGVLGGDFRNVGYYGDWSSASENYDIFAYIRLMSYDFESTSWLGNDKTYMLSVRCLKD